MDRRHLKGTRAFTSLGAQAIALCALLIEPTAAMQDTGRPRRPAGRPDPRRVEREAEKARLEKERESTPERSYTPAEQRALDRGFAEEAASAPHEAASKRLILDAFRRPDGDRTPLQRNRAQGEAYERQIRDWLSGRVLIEQVRLSTIDRRVRTIADFLFFDKNSGWYLVEAKSSVTAGLSVHQRAAYQRIKEGEPLLVMSKKWHADPNRAQQTIIRVAGVLILRGDPFNKASPGVAQWIRPADQQPAPATVRTANRRY